MESPVVPPRTSDQDPGSGQREGWAVSVILLSAALTFDAVGTDWLPPSP